jgi:hypothetical protein
MAQQIEVQFGETYKLPPKTNLTAIYGQDEDGIFAGRYKRKGLLGIRQGTPFVDYYDKDLSLAYSKELEFPRDEMYREYTALINDTLFVFIGYFDKEKSINYLYGSYYSREGVLNSNFAQLAAVEVENKRKLNSFDIVNSVDSTKFLIAVIPRSERKVEQKVHFIVVDHRYREYDQVRIEFPFQSRDFSFQTLELSNNGDIHLMAAIPKDDEGEKRKARTKVKELRLFTFYKEDQMLHEYPIRIGENYISEYKMRVRNNGDVLVTGFYSDFRSNSMKGIFYLEIEPSTKSVKNLKNTDFTESFLKLFISKRKAKKKRELANFEVRDIFVKPDGGIQFLAEYYYYYVTITQDANGNIRETHHYNYGDIIVADMDKNGKINWWTKIPKRQNTVNDVGYYSGMSYYYINNKLHLVYNEHERNIKEVDPDRIRNIRLKKAWTVLVTVDENGKVEKTPMFKAKDRKLLLVPKSGSKISENEQVFVSVAGFGKAYRLCRIKFN